MTGEGLPAAETACHCRRRELVRVLDCHASLLQSKLLIQCREVHGLAQNADEHQDLCGKQMMMQALQSLQSWRL